MATPDVATTNTRTHEISLLLLQHNGASFFVVQNTFLVGLGPSDLVVGDLNNDTLPDLVTANFSSSDVSVLIGRRADNAFTFEPEQRYDVGARPRAVTVADVNNDGNLDILTANSSPVNNITILIGQGDGTFPFLRLKQDLQAGEEPIDLAVGDLNDDGFLDLVTVNNGSDDVSILLGQGDALFGPERQFPVGRRPRQVIIADFNANDKLDVATANGGTDNVSVLLGLGDGTLLVEQG
ncbi:hypothetical protein C2W62_23105 [Candidatus Entotheonella serta]|nr:hypothetical protein C2W62_23105 [Candidatus Entotheonella serta]